MFEFVKPRPSESLQRNLHRRMRVFLYVLEHISGTFYVPNIAHKFDFIPLFA